MARVPRFWRQTCRIRKEPDPKARLSRPTPSLLLELCCRPGFLQASDRLLRVGLADVLQHRLRRCIDEVLGLLKAELGQLADRLDHVDLAVADRGEGDGELRLLLDRLRAGACRGRRSNGGHRRRGLDADLVLDGLHSLDHVEDAPVLQGLDEVLWCELGCHVYAASNLVLYASSMPKSC